MVRITASVESVDLPHNQSAHELSIELNRDVDVIGSSPFSPLIWE